MKILSKSLLKLKIQHENTNIGGVIENDWLVSYYKGKAPEINMTALRPHFKMKNCVFFFMPTLGGNSLIVITERSVNFIEIDGGENPRCDRLYILTQLLCDETKELIQRSQRLLSNGKGRIGSTIDISFQRLLPKEVVAAIFLLDSCKYRPRVEPSSRPGKGTYWGELKPGVSELLSTGNISLAVSKRGSPLLELQTVSFGFPETRSFVFQAKGECYLPFYDAFPNQPVEKYLALAAVPPKPSSVTSDWRGFLEDLGLTGTLDTADVQWLVEQLEPPPSVKQGTVVAEPSELKLDKDVESCIHANGKKKDDKFYQEFKKKLGKGSSRWNQIRKEIPNVNRDFFFEKIARTISKKQMKSCIMEVKKFMTIEASKQKVIIPDTIKDLAASSVSSEYSEQNFDCSDTKSVRQNEVSRDVENTFTLDAGLYHRTDHQIAAVDSVFPLAAKVDTELVGSATEPVEDEGKMSHFLYTEEKGRNKSASFVAADPVPVEQKSPNLTASFTQAIMDTFNPAKTGGYLRKRGFPEEEDPTGFKAKLMSPSARK